MQFFFVEVLIKETLDWSLPTEIMNQKILQEKFTPYLLTIPHWVRINVKMNQRVNLICDTFIFESHDHERVEFSLLFTMEVIRNYIWKFSIVAPFGTRTGLKTVKHFEKFLSFIEGNHKVMSRLGSINKAIGSFMKLSNKIGIFYFFLLIFFELKTL